MRDYEYAKIQDLKDKVFTKVYRSDDIYDRNEGLVFENDDEKFILVHLQDCCEYVRIEDICGELSSLENEKLVFVEESSSDDPNASESGTWTFYKFATINGWVDVRFYGSSNGYYSEGVSVLHFKKK